MKTEQPSGLRVYLLDDEPLAIRYLSHMLEKFEGVEVLGKSTAPDQALLFLSEHEVDLLFLDVHMPGLDGFSVLRQLRHPPAVVFTTAHDQYAVQAFRADAVDFLLKPVRAEDLAKALEKVAKRAGNAASTEASSQAMQRVLTGQSAHMRPPNYPTRITSRVGERMQVIDLKRVTHFLSEDNLTYAVTPEKRHIVAVTISDLEQKLDPAGFARIHRATIVNLSWVDEVHSWFGGHLLIRLKESRGELKVARDRARTLKQSLGL